MLLADITPTRSEYVAIVRGAAKGSGLPPWTKGRLTLHAKKAPSAVYGADAFAGASCPLRAVGVERTWSGAWGLRGARAFQIAYDKAMYKRTRVPGPCLIGIKKDKG